MKICHPEHVEGGNFKTLELSTLNLKLSKWLTINFKY